MEKKKLMSLFALGCGALLLTGCGTESKKDDDDNEKETKKEKVVTKQTVKCKTETEQNGMMVIAETVFVYDKKEEKIVDGSMTMTLDLSEQYNKLSDAQKKEADKKMAEGYNSMCENFEGQGYKNCTHNFKNGKVKVSTGFDLDKLEKLTDGEIKIDMVPEDIKESLEKTKDTTCTIENN